MNKTFMTMASLIAITTAFSAQSAESSLKVFNAGETAKAADVNHNFNVLHSGIADLTASVQALSDRVTTIENDSQDVVSVSGRCYSLTSYEVEIARNDDANPDFPSTSQNGYVPGIQVKNGYAFFDEVNNTGRINVRRDTVNQYFLESGGGNFSRADAGENGDYTHTEYTNHNITWSQTGSVVTTERDRGEGEAEKIKFSASMGGDVLVATDIETNAFSNGSKNGSVELYLLNEMDCSEAQQGEAAFPQS